MNMQHSLIWEFMLYKLELDINTAEITKNNCCVKSENEVDHSTVTRWFKKFHIACRDIDNQARPGRPKSVDSEAMLQAIDINMASSTWRVSVELYILITYWSHKTYTLLYTQTRETSTVYSMSNILDC